MSDAEILFRNWPVFLIMYIYIKIFHNFFLRLAYPVWMLNNLLDEIHGRSLDVCILYDIACLLETHLKVGVFFPQ